MNGQITIEQMQMIIGRLTMNYELQISNLQTQLQQAMQPVAEPVTPVTPIKK